MTTMRHCCGVAVTVFLLSAVIGQQECQAQPAQAEAQAEPQTEPRLKFNFRFQKWAEVLDWMADEAGLSLVMDEAPAGTFNYSDSKEYTPTEAIDLLNGWLMIKGYTLVRRERMLMSLNLKDGLPDNAIPRVTVDDLATRGRFEFVSVLIPMQGRLAETVLTEITPLLGTYGKAEVLTATQQMLVVDSAASVRVIQDVVQQVPLPTKPAVPTPAVPAPKPELVVYPIQHANPEQAGEVLKTIIAGTLVVDAAAGQISVNAIPAEQAKAKIIIQQLESNQGPDSQPLLKMYAARSANSVELLATLKLIAPDAQFRYDEASRKLVAWANQAQQLQIATSLEEMVGQQSNEARTQLEVYPLQDIAPTTAQALITTLLPDARITLDARTSSLIAIGTLADHQAIRELLLQLEQQTADVPLGQLKSYPLNPKVSAETTIALLAGLTPSATVTSDAASRRLLITATPQDHEAIAAAIAQVSQDAGGELPELQFYPLQNASGTNAAAVLTAILPTATVTFETEAQRISVVGSKADHAVVVSTLAKLEAVAPADEKRSLKIYDVTTNQRARFTTVLVSLTTELPGLQVLTDAQPGEMTVWAKPSQHEIVAEVLTQLRRDVPAAEQARLVVYPITKVDVASVSTVLVELFPDVKITADAVASRLLIHAKPAVHETIRLAIEQLDSDIGGETEIKLMVYPINGVDAISALQLLNTEVPRITVIHDTTAQTFIVRARLPQQQQVAELLDSLQSVSTPLQKRTAVVYPTSHSQSTTEQTFFQNAFPNATFVLDPIRQTMTALATTADQNAIRETVEAMSDNGAKTAELKEYSVLPTDIIGVSGMLKQAAPNAQLVFADNKLLAWAMPQEQTVIERIVNGLQKSSGDRRVAAFDVSRLQITNALAVLAQQVPDVSFITAQDGNSVVALVDDDTKQKIQTTLTQLTESPAATAKRSLKLYSVKDAGPAATTVLAQSVPTAAISIGAQPNQIAVVATSQDHEKLAQLLQQLQTAGKATVEKTLVVHDIRGTDPVAVQAVLQPLIDADVSITVDATGRRLYVRAFPEQQQVVKATIEQITKSLTPDGSLETKTYLVGAPNADEAQEVLLALYPDATIVMDSDRKLIVATATSEQHVMIEKIAKQISGVGHLENAPYAVVYKLTTVSAAQTQQVLSNLFTRFDAVQLSVNERTGRLVAVARDDQHQIIAKLIEEFEGDPADEIPRELAVYRVAPLDGLTVKTALEPLVSENVLISADRRGSEILVSAPPEEQQKIAALIQEITASRFHAGMETRTYRMNIGDADAAQTALLSLFPEATLVTDRRDKVLVATATPEQHKTIETVVQQMNGNDQSADKPVPKTYRLNQADGETVVEVLDNLFETVDDVRLSLDEVNQAVVAIARPDQHQLIEQTLADLDPQDGAAAHTLQVYPVEDLDEEQVQQVVNDMLVERYPGSKVHHEAATGNLLVTTNQAGHKLVEDAIARFGRPEPREADVFQLTYLEPFTAQTAIENLISSRYPSEINQPIIYADEDTQQLWVQASKTQLAEMRTLLMKMGEAGLGIPGIEKSNPNLRIIPVGGDVDETIKRIQDLWPKLRRNPIKVMKPKATSMRRGIPGPAFSSLGERHGASRPPSRAIDPRLAPSGSRLATSGQPASLKRPGYILTSLPDELSNERSNENQTTPSETATSQPPAELPAVVIVPGDGRLTIASDDAEALDQLESLLRAMHSRPGGGGRNQDFGVYQLTNAGAVDVSTTLQQIFDDSDGLISFGDVVMVPDERLNVLIVYASRADRGRIEQLLEMLDSEKFEDTRRSFRTEVVPLQYASADRVEDVIQGVYAAERTSGGARSNIAIPKGVPTNVASVLRQINAAASSPLLTVEVQTDTNSLVIKAPQELLDEVKALVQRLDEASRTTRARGITLLPLKKVNSSRVMKILNDVLD